jgi:pimeloyl-ACP methyl ester carboxylesterase
VATVDVRDVPVVEPTMLDVAGSPVALRRRGEGRPVLFLHGAGFTGKWLRFHEALAQGADLIAPEHVGFGASPLQDWLDGFDDLVLHYDDLRAQLGLDEPFDLVGYSLGGWIAALYAIYYPDRIRSLTLITPAGYPLEGDSVVDLFHMYPDELFATIFNDPTNMGEVAGDPNDIDVAVKGYEEASTTARLVWERRDDPKMPRRLRRVTAPALVVGAEHDRLIPDEAVDAYATALPSAEVVRIPGTGHALVVEQPEATAKAILDFQERAR